MSKFGKKRLNDFYLDPNYININHGSYGACPKQVMKVKRQYQQIMDFNPEQWFRVDAEKQITSMRQFIAKFVNCSYQNIFIVQNATDAFNCLMKSMVWQQGDTILLPNTAYSAISKTIQFIKERFGIKILQVNFTQKDFASQESILLKIEDTVNSYGKQIKLAVIDHIISVPGIICPIEVIKQFLDEHKIPLFVDGAHAICQTPIDLMNFTPAAYFSNFHKWGYSPKNAAFLYISDKYLKMITPALTGNFYGQGIERQFFWTGTRDFSSYLSIKAGIQYYQSFGSNQVHDYNHNLAVQGGKKIAQIWKTYVLSSDQRCTGYLNNVRVPIENIQVAQKIAYQMLEKYNCFPIFFKFDNKIYIRISAQVFNQLSDYEFAARKFLQIAKLNKINID